MTSCVIYTVHVHEIQKVTVNDGGVTVNLGFCCRSPCVREISSFQLEGVISCQERAP
jgi:hypothetical protein